MRSCLRTIQKEGFSASASEASKKKLRRRLLDMLKINFRTFLGVIFLR